MIKYILSSFLFLASTATYAKTYDCNVGKKNERIDCLSLQLSDFMSSTNSKIAEYENTIKQLQDKANATAEGSYFPKFTFVGKNGNLLDANQYFEISKAIYFKIGNKVFVSVRIYLKDSSSVYDIESFTLDLPLERTDGKFINRNSLYGISSFPLSGPAFSKLYPINAVINDSLAKVVVSGSRFNSDEIEVNFVYDLKN